jgi:hypothetical protein
MTEQMIGDRELRKPKATHLREYFSFIRDAVWEDIIKGRDSIGADDQ